MSKQYGLIIPGQEKKPVLKQTQILKKPSIFDESSSSDSDHGAPQKLSKASVPMGASFTARRAARVMMEEAVSKDPTIFQYDELYDEMDNKRVEAKQTKSQEPRKPKYIGRLLKHAEQRKLEYELLIERQVQKDREAEGEKFKDKDIYVTATYRKKLESIREMQEKEKRDEYLEVIGDVTKQNNLDGFYRHLYEQKLGTQEPVCKPNTAPAAEDVSYKPIKPEKAVVAKQRSYRRRQSSDEESKVQKPGLDKTSPVDNVLPSTSKGHLTNNIDADSDFSIDDSSDEEEQAKEKKENNSKEPTQGQTSLESADKLRAAADKTTTKPQKSETQDDTTVAKPMPDSTADLKAATPVAPATPEIVRQPIDRSYIWKKRTVGDIFEAAVARYVERKKARRA